MIVCVSFTGFIANESLFLSDKPQTPAGDGYDLQMAAVIMFLGIACLLLVVMGAVAAAAFGMEAAQTFFGLGVGCFLLASTLSMLAAVFS